MLLHLNEASGRCGAKAEMIYRISRFTEGSTCITLPKSRVISTTYYNEKIRPLNNADEIRQLAQTEILPYVRKEFNTSPLVIRSSATCEDSALFSGAGVYDSFLNLMTDEQIVNAIVKVYVSFKTDNARFYAKYNSVNYNTESIAILIQELAPVTTSGILFTIDPITYTNDVIIEYTMGLGDKVVSGDSSIIRNRFSKTKSIEESNTILSKLIDFALKFEKELNSPIDVEWGYNDSCIYIFQVRPVVKSDLSRNCDSPIRDGQFVVSKGIGIGQIQSVFSESISFDKIIVRDAKCDITDILKLLYSRGFLINTGGLLSHFANLIREFCIPCIFINSNLALEKDIYVIDGYRNIFTRMADLSLDDKKKYIVEYFEEIMELFYHHSYRYGSMKMKSIFKNTKYESVVFDIPNESINILNETCPKKKEGLQRIYTYDFCTSSLFQRKTYIRIQLLGEDCRVQFKTIEMDTNRIRERIKLFNYDSDSFKYPIPFRTENEYVIGFEDYDSADAFLISLGLSNTGYQERYITSYVYNDYQFNLTQWPKGNPFLGIECHDPNNFKSAISMIGVSRKQCVAVDGKQIFDKFGLTLSDCSFGE